MKSNVKFLFLGYILSTLITTSVTKRMSRSLIGLTNGGRINIGVQFILPLTVSLPMVSGNSGRRRRTINDMEYSALSQNGVKLRKLDFYFDQLNVDEESCRQRLLCEMSAQPDIYHPLSHLLLEKFIENFKDEYYEKPPLPRMHIYATAVKMGEANNSTCSIIFSSCIHSPAQLLNLPILRAWQMIDQFFHINLYEELDF